METEYQLQLPQRPYRSKDITDIRKRIALATNHFRISLEKSLIPYLQANDIEPSIENANDIALSIENDDQSLLSKIIKNIKNKVQEQFGNFFQSSSTLEGIKENVNQFVIDKKSIKDQSNFVLQRINKILQYIFNQSVYLEIGGKNKFYKKQYRTSNLVYDQKNDYGIYVWQGLKATTCLSQKEAILYINFSSRVFRKETALQFLNDRCQNNFKEIIGKFVIASYGRYRIYRVDDVLDCVEGIKYQFYIHNKQYTLEEYFLKMYQIKIKNKQQPILLNIIKNKITNDKKIFYLVPELMLMADLTEDQIQNRKLMKDIAKFTKPSPNQCMEQISECAKLIHNNIYDNQIQIKNEVTVIESFQLKAPNLKLAKYSCSAYQGKFNIRDKIIKPCNLNNWALVYYSKGTFEDSEANNFVSNLQICSQKYGIKVDLPGFVVVQNTKAQDWIKSIQEDIKENGEPQIIVTLIQSKFKNSLYPILKVCSKILLQINAKLGLPLWITPRPNQLSDRTMIIGIDIYHKFIQKRKICFGIVATLDSLFSVFFSKVMLRPPGKEFSNIVGQLVEEALKQYFLYNDNKFFPDTIILYRDGCGESQIQTALYEEVQSIYKSFTNISKDYNPKFAEIIINKRINQRFFVLDVGKGDSRGGKGCQNQQGQYVNPKSGTIVADLFNENKFDYFICSQKVKQGICTPTHYTVIQDTTGLNEEVFWQLTYFQCFNYYNWSGAVKVPAPVQYAHKLCQLAGETFQDNFNEKLNQTLFYL